jgi:hypothetical protein
VPFPLILVSWSAQAVTRQERVEQVKAKTAAYLSRYAPLNVRGVNASRSLDEDRSEPNSRQEERLVRRRPRNHHQGAGSEGPYSPRLRKCHCYSARNESHGCMADRVHYRSYGKAHEFSPPGYAAQLPDVIKKDGPSLHRGVPRMTRRAESSHVRAHPVTDERTAHHPT